ncbi:MAG: histidine kinase [Ekhidna sp.]
MNVKYGRFLGIILLLIIAQLSFSQSPYFRHITAKDGLPNSTIYSITQDNLGFVWMGTENGLCRFDGVNFERYETPSDRSISADDLIFDGDNRIYFKNFSNQLFYYENDTVIEIPIPEQYGQLYNLHTVAKDQLIISLDATLIYNINTKEWEALPIDGKLAQSVDTLNQKIYISKNDSVAVYDLEQKKYLKNLYVNLAVHAINSKAGNTIVLSLVDQKAFLVAPEGNQAVFPSLFNLMKGRIINWYRDREGKYWIITTNGLLCYEDLETPFLNGLNYLQNNFISDFLHDQEGNYWFSTIGNGVFVMYQNEALVFNHGNSELQYDQIKRIEVINDDQLLLATNGEKAYKMSGSGKIIDAYNTPMGDIECIYLDKKKEKIYFESYQYNANKQNEWIRFFAGNTPKNIVEINDDILCIASGDGAYLIKKPQNKNPPWPKGFDATSGNKFTTFDLYPNAIALRNVRSRDVHYDPIDSTIWIGFIDGLFAYKHGVSRKLNFPDGEIITALNFSGASDGSFWVGTVNSGLVNIKESKINMRLTIKNGLLSNYINVVKVDGDFLYLATDKGLQRYHLPTGTSKSFNEQDGLPTNDITDLGITNNLIWIATLNGLVSLPKEFEGQNNFPPKVQLTKVYINGERVTRKNKVLSHDENDLTFAFTGIAHRSEGKFTYKYRLIGLEEDWTSATSGASEARFFALPSGTYEFQVKTINEDGVESDTVKTPFEIAKPYWQTWWFVAMLVALLVLIVSTVFVIRINQIKRKNKLEQDIQMAHLNALKLQMNPHFLFNSMTAIQDYILHENPQRASHYVGIFSTLMREILENSRKEFVTIRAEINMLKKYIELQQVRFEEQINYCIDIDEELDIDYEGIPPMFAQPFIENAIEHGLFKKAENQITIAFKKLTDDLVSLEISDNGIGIKKESQQKEHHSLATTIVKERLAILQQVTDEQIAIQIQNIESKETGKILGLKVALSLPLEIILE